MSVEPALTAEEWARTAEEPEVGQMMVAEAWPIDGDNNHARAALLLHGQPFGFQREDVWLLRSLAPHVGLQTFKSQGRDLGTTEQYLNGLADRIAALLPPR